MPPGACSLGLIFFLKVMVFLFVKISYFYTFLNLIFTIYTHIHIYIVPLHFDVIESTLQFKSDEKFSQYVVKYKNQEIQPHI